MSTIQCGVVSLYKCAVRMQVRQKENMKKKRSASNHGTGEEWPGHNVLYQGTTVLDLRWRLYQRVCNSRVVRVSPCSLSTKVERKWIALSDRLASARPSTTSSMVGRCSGSAFVIASTRSRTNSNPWYFYNVIFSILIYCDQATRTCMKFSRTRLPRQ